MTIISHNVYVCMMLRLPADCT